MMRRQGGLVVPLFSLVSRQGWGIGEFPDLAVFARWAHEAGQSVIQILPINELPPIESSPYSAMTAMALDPVYIALRDVPDFSGLGGEFALEGAEQAEVARLQQSPRVEYASVRRLKGKWLRRSFDRFLKLEVSRGTPRAQRFEAFRTAQAWWLDEYALFRALHALHEELPWFNWPGALAEAANSTRTALFSFSLASALAAVLYLIVTRPQRKRLLEEEKASEVSVEKPPEIG